MQILTKQQTNYIIHGIPIDKGNLHKNVSRRNPIYCSWSTNNPLPPFLFYFNAYFRLGQVEFGYACLTGGRDLCSKSITWDCHCQPHTLNNSRKFTFSHTVSDRLTNRRHCGVATLLKNLFIVQNTLLHDQLLF